ncbi:hypothetical protein [Gulosibacter faecalis]|uniref:DUF4265 domain-containing protein n=1 Tax=Gulosibacter faecalis TaxID=272240 RepID=A0ABW5UTY0_9MICO|nr:hypothetical protein [Gulosibacter faecalis]
MSRSEGKALEALLEGRGYPVFLGEVPSTFDGDLVASRERRYVLILPTFTPDVQTRFTGSYAARDASFVVHCYARTFDEAGWLAEAVDAVLRPRGFGVRPVVEGRNCHPIKRSESYGPDREEAGAGLWDAFSEYGFMSYPK